MVVSMLNIRSKVYPEDGEVRFAQKGWQAFTRCHISGNNNYSHRRENLQSHTVKIYEKGTAENVGGLETPHCLEDKGRHPSDGRVYQSSRRHVPEYNNIHINA